MIQWLRKYIPWKPSKKEIAAIFDEIASRPPQHSRGYVTREDGSVREETDEEFRDRLLNGSKKG